jgi:shikimate dehydrogenase
VEQYGCPLWVVGSPLSHTLSPPIHNAAFKEADLPHRYFALEVQEEELQQFLENFRNLKGLGANLTLPLKETVQDYISSKTAAVQATKAANTIFWSDGQLRLDNTDVYGFKQLVGPWDRVIRHDSVLILGAGGAARACLQGFNEMNVSNLYLWNRTNKKAEGLARSFESLNVSVLNNDQLEDPPGDIKLVVNATSLGLESGDPSPFPPESVRSDQVGVDLIYGKQTRFLEAFRNRGRDAVDGLTMLIQQAARSWERWVGHEPNISAMESVVQSGNST